VAGYSATPLVRKLGIREDSTVALVHAPATMPFDLPPSVKVTRRIGRACDVVVAFFTTASALTREVDALAAMIFPDGGLWIAWPKKASGVSTDVTQHVVRDVCLPLGLVDNKVCAIDDTWSGLRVVWRVQRRSLAR